MAQGMGDSCPPLVRILVLETSGSSMGEGVCSPFFPRVRKLTFAEYLLCAGCWAQYVFSFLIPMIFW